MALISIWLIVAAIFGVIGALAATSKGRDPLGWFLLCFFFPIIGLLLLLVLGLAGEVPGNAGRVGSDAEWNALVDYDEEIQAALKELEAFGKEGAEELRRAYMAIKDKSKLPGFVTAIRERLEALPDRLEPVEVVKGVQIYRDYRKEYVVGGIRTMSLQNARIAARNLAK